MGITWDTALAQCHHVAWDAPDHDAMPLVLGSLLELKEYLDCLHIKYCLLKPFYAHEDYPLVETRDLLPSFEPDPYEYRHLDGFSFVALERPLHYFQEIFQFDMLHGLVEKRDSASDRACPPGADSARAESAHHATPPAQGGAGSIQGEFFGRGYDRA